LGIEEKVAVAIEAIVLGALSLDNIYSVEYILINDEVPVADFFRLLK
jgi:hypothetical protein